MADTTVAEEAVEPKEVVVDIRVVALPDRYVTFLCNTDAKREAALRRWAEELEKFVRDHRSQAPVDLRVERVEETQCSGCSHEWDPMEDDDHALVCSWCGRPVKAA